MKKQLPLIFTLLLISTLTFAIDLKGNIDKDSVITLSNSPCNITADVIVRNGAKLSFESGVIVNFSNAGFELYIGSTATSKGILSANNVTFNGFGTSTVDELIVFRFNSTGVLDNCTFNNVSVVSNESSPTISNSTFLNSVYPLEFQSECSPTLSNLNLSGTTNKGIKLSGTVNTDWTMQNYGYPYFLTAALSVNTGAKLTIAPNDTIKIVGAFAITAGTSTTSLGTIDADGVIFQGVTTSTTDQLAFKFGSTGKITNCSFTAFDLTCSASSPEINGNTFSNAFISLNESSPLIGNNKFENSTYPLEFINECSPTVGKMTMNNVTNRGIKLSGTVNADWTMQNYGYPYFLAAPLLVNTGAKLTMAPNDTVKIVGAYAITAGTSSTSLGTINADGVVFQGVSTSTIDQLAFKFGSTGKISNCSFTAVDLTCSVSSPEITGNRFNNAFISLNESSPTVGNNTFENVTYPLEFVNECSPTVGVMTMNNVTYPGIKLSGTVNTDWTMLNYGYTYYLAAALTVNTGAKLTIAQNNTVYLAGTYAITAGASATSMGTINANGVIFQGVISTSVDQLAFKFGSTGLITNCSFTAFDLTCSTSSPEITGNNFNNAFISLNESSPVIGNNTFDNVTYPLEFVNECSPTVGVMTMNNVTNRGIKLSGIVNTDWTLQNYSYPYYLTAALAVNTGAKLTIAQNDTIKIVGNFAITAGFSATSLGTINANGVIFQGITTSGADQLAFKFGSTGKITNCSFTAFDLTCSVSSPEITGNIFNNAFISMNESSPVLGNNTFQNTSYPLEFINECSPAMGPMTLNNITNRGIKLSGTVNTDWTLQNYGYPYYLAAALAVNSGATLTISPNDTIKFIGGFAITAGASVTSLGAINADSVIFQSSTVSTADQLAFKFGSSGKITNCSFTSVNLTCTTSSPDIAGNTFNNAYISLNESSPTIGKNTFENGTFPLEFVNECSPALGVMTMNNITNRGIKLSGTVDTDWTLLRYEYPYYLAANLVVNSGAKLIIATNDTIKFVGAYALSAGTSTTSLGTINADGVIFQGVTTGVADQLAFKFGSTGKISNCTFTAVDLSCSASSPVITGNIFNNAMISMNESSPVIENITFENSTYPLEFINECSPTLGVLTMSNVTNPGIKLSGTVNSNWTMLNYGYPYYLTAALTVNNGAAFTSAHDNIIYMNGFNISVGSSVTSTGIFNVKRNVFKNLKTADNIIYYRFGAGGELDSCDFTGIRLYIDASNPKITRSKFHKAQNSVYVINSTPVITSNIFFNNTLALKNAGATSIDAFNNFWGHQSGPMHPDNPTGLGEKIEGLVNFSNFSQRPYYGTIKPETSVLSLNFDTLHVGFFKDLSFMVKSHGDIDLLIPDIIMGDPSFKVMVPSTRRSWVSNGDSVEIKFRFQPKRPANFDVLSSMLTNDVDNPKLGIRLTGVGKQILAFSEDSLLFDSVPVRSSSKKILEIQNVNNIFSVIVDSIVNSNPNFYVFQTNKPAALKVKSTNESIDDAAEENIITPGFSIFKNESAYLAVEYWPYKTQTDIDSLKIYYNSGGIHTIPLKANCLTEDMSTKIVSLDYRQFPNIYMNAEIDTSAVSINSLTEKNIQVYENGVHQTEGFGVVPPGEGNNTRLTDIIFLMDNSGSMSEEQAQVKANVNKFLTSLNRSGINYSLGLCRYGATENAGYPIIEDNGALTQDSTYFRNVLWNRNNVSGGFEPGFYSIMESASKFKFRPGSQKIFIIITDETPLQGNLGTEQKAIDVCVNQKITTFALTTKNLYENFIPIAVKTNGKVFNILSQFDAILNMISNMVSGNYVVQYTSSDPILNGVKRNVELKVSYKLLVASDTTSYVPGAIPSIVRTAPTINLHKKAWEPGTPLTIEAEVKDAIPPFVNNVILNFRTSKTSTYYSLQMNSTNGVLYSAAIPDSIVKTPGVDYYITASDGMVSCDDPAIDANNNPYQIAVIPNIAPSIEHTPLTEAFFGKDIVVRANVTDYTIMLSAVELYYRKAGQLVFTKLHMTNVGNNLYEGIISGSFSMNEDIEYYIKATDDYGVSSYTAWPYNPFVISMKNAVGFNPVNAGTGPEIYPNPVNNFRFVISFNNLNSNEKLRVTLVNAAGIRLTELYNDYLPVGKNNIPVKLNKISGGVYFIEISTGSDIWFRKVMIE